MAVDFAKTLDVVKTGVYGKDVRQAIYDLFLHQKDALAMLENMVDTLVGYGSIVTIYAPSEIRPTNGSSYN